jgi:16S rRNA (cytosine967-C5)-methyltransferase
VKDSVTLQSSLLDRLWPLLDTGGILLYATCSVLKDENDRQIKQFLERTSGAEILGFDGDWGRPVTTGRQILPGDFDMDGFFYARLRKHF